MRFVDIQQDSWRPVEGEDAPNVTITPAPQRLLTLAQWHAVRAQWPRELPVAVAVPNDAAIEDLAEDLPRIALVVLHFPKWTDGRAYSQARLLRSRYRFAGAVRATGEVLVDMMPLLSRTGFDQAQMRADQGREAAERALHFFPGHYQADVHEQRPLFSRRAAA
jgi:uncharacterized protein (DUF934 family)